MKNCRSSFVFSAVADGVFGAGGGVFRGWITGLEFKRWHSTCVIR